MERLLSYPSLLSHYTNIKSSSINSLFQDEKRLNLFTKKIGNLHLDLSKNLITKETVSLFVQLANDAKIKSKIQDMITGKNINFTEKRAVLHTALRNSTSPSVLVNEKNVIPEIRKTAEDIKTFVDKFRSQELKSFNNKNFTDIVNIGIGGSYLGTEMAYQALKQYDNPHNIKLHFIANVDGAATTEILENINPETTLFVVASKTFTTAETMLNAQNVKNWFIEKTKQNDISKNFVALSTNLEMVKKFGIDLSYTFGFWDFIGGRYSIWSAIGLPLALIIGNKGFEEFLKGAEIVDQNLQEENLIENIPFLLAILGIWYRNFFNYSSYAILPYSYQLRNFTKYIQQLEMESNGKYVNTQGQKINHATSPVVFGEPGTDSQHSFFQMLHQGTDIIPCDFIGFAKSPSKYTQNHDILMSNLFAQTEALMNGKPLYVVKQELEAQKMSNDDIEKLAPHKVFMGNRPTSTFLFEELNPQAIGTLCALYEHKIFIQGLFWDINSFDQWGVELGKQLAVSLLKDIEGDEVNNSKEPSTINLINTYKKLK